MLYISLRSRDIPSIIKKKMKMNKHTNKQEESITRELNGNSYLYYSFDTLNGTATSCLPSLRDMWSRFYEECQSSVEINGVAKNKIQGTCHRYWEISQWHDVLINLAFPFRTLELIFFKFYKRRGLYTENYRGIVQPRNISTHLP